ncbi:MAG: hypothetical protein R8G34_13925 [Paracoccaceae bacterium]|nr:hypothetical protein [Paracoccaceae bacterium]
MSKSRRYSALNTVATAALLISGQSAHAQEQSLQSQASDPTASLMSFQLQNFYSPNLHNSGADQNILQFRAAIPFQIGGINNIARVTLPYATDTASGKSGFQDITVFNLAAFDQSWGRYGIGAVALLPTGSSDLTADKWGLGPALGFVARPSWGLFGLFNQNIFTIAGDDDDPDVNISTIQPILNVGLGNGWSVGSSDMTFVYDWEASEFTSLPLGVKVSKLTKLGQVPFQVQLSYERNFYDDRIGPEDTLGLTFKVLLPR